MSLWGFLKKYALPAASIYSGYQGMKAQGDAARAQAAAVQDSVEAQRLQAQGQAFNLRRRAESIDFNRRVSKENRKLAEMTIEDMRHRAAVAVSNRSIEGLQLHDTQLAQMASSGFLAMGGSNARILQDTKTKTERDITQMINNSNLAIYEQEMDMWSARMQEELMRRQAENDRMNAVIAEETGRQVEGTGAVQIQAIQSAAKAQKTASVVELANQLHNLYTRQV